MLEALLILLLLAAIMQPTSDRLYAASVFAWMAIAHYASMYLVDGWVYYFSAAIADALVVFFTLKLRVISHVIASIHTICYVSIVMNFFGWIIWMLYLPPDSYNAAFLLIYFWAIINLLRKERGDAYGADTLGVGHHYFFTSPGKSGHSNKKQAN